MKWRSLAVVPIGAAQLGILALFIWRREAYLEEVHSANDQAVKEGRAIADPPTFPYVFAAAGVLGIVALFGLAMWLLRKPAADVTPVPNTLPATGEGKG